MLMVANFQKNMNISFKHNHFVKILSVVVAICFLFICIPSPSYAIDAATMTALMALAEYLNAYGQYYGISTHYDLTTGDGIDNIQAQWDEFNSFMNSSHNTTYDILDVYEHMKEEGLMGFTDEDGNPSQDPSDWGSYSKLYLAFDEYLSEICDQFWDYMLTGPAEMTRVDNQFHFDNFDQIKINELHIGIEIDGTRLYLTPLDSYVGSYRFQLQSTNNIPTYYYYCRFLEGSNYYYTLVFVSTASSIAVRWQVGNFGWISRSNPNAPSYQNLLYYTDFGTDRYISATPITGLEYIDLPDDHCLPPDVWGADAPVESIDDTVSISAKDEDKVVPLPNPWAQDYTPTAVDIVIDKDKDEVDEDFPVPLPWPLPDGAVDDVVEDTFPDVTDNDYEIVEEAVEDPDEPPPENEVFLPFLPVSLPSFNFNFSGIWHYVREWVASIGSFMTMLFSVWSALPYAIIVPVYATAVVVIVLGVYRRFFM